ncbi:hypothetical protein KCP73_03210 [Salmonella enterica subsp. enterica]|nr:hypothetical protein KCP73_03210 [Salmonella enterica subsp. enterica]
MATDIAARGLILKSRTWSTMNCRTCREDCVHRIGRTCRAAAIRRGAVAGLC